MKVLKFTESITPITEPITKFGGQPVWISDPQWPLSRTTNEPMRFICQIALRPELQLGGQQMAYVFMTDGEEHVDGTWDPEDGENAVILQPSTFDPICEIKNQAAGPTIEQRKTGPLTRTFMDRVFKREHTWQEGVELAAHVIDILDDEDTIGSKLEGDPFWLQNDETPQDGTWLFLVQIDSEPILNLNFGDAGVGYAFVRDDGRAARFLWQCC